MATLAFERSGTGPTLVLLHGIGCSRRVWDPVAPLLAEHFDVLMVDLPGFGESKPLPAEVEPHPAALAAVVGQTHGRPARMSADRARMMVREMGNCPGFDTTMAATVHRHYAAGAPFETPVTLAFGSRDLLLRRRSRRLEQLPPGVHLETLPGCGHVPMSDDPGAVTEVITAATALGVGGDRKSGVIAGLARSSSL